MNKTFTESKPLAFEILRLKSEGALPMTVIMRQAQWVQMARKEGLPEPTKPLDPLTATPAEIARATVWSNVGGVIPRTELEHDGGKAYLASIRDAVTLHTQGFDALLALHAKEPDVQKDLLKRELGQLGAPAPTGDPSVADLRQSLQNAILAKTGKALVADANELAQRKYIGLDGRVGTEERLLFYERGEAIAAMYSDTAFGSIAANAPSVVHPSRPPNVPEMRGLGQLGDHAETLYSNHSPALPPGVHAPERECRY